jgi:hypothetical protein
MTTRTDDRHGRLRRGWRRDHGTPIGRREPARAPRRPDRGLRAPDPRRGDFRRPLPEVSRRAIRWTLVVFGWQDFARFGGDRCGRGRRSSTRRPTRRNSRSSTFLKGKRPVVPVPFQQPAGLRRHDIGQECRHAGTSIGLPSRACARVNHRSGEEAAVGKPTRAFDGGVAFAKEPRGHPTQGPPTRARRALSVRKRGGRGRAMHAGCKFFAVPDHAFVGGPAFPGGGVAPGRSSRPI